MSSIPGMAPDLDLDQVAEEFLATEVEIGETRFRFSKLPAMRGYALLEKIRTAIGRHAGVQSSAGMGAIVRAVLSLPPEFVEEVRIELFGEVKFSNRMAQTAQTLAGAEDTAFADLEPVAVYEVLVRCLAVNFTESFRQIASRLGVGEATSSSPDR